MNNVGGELLLSAEELRVHNRWLQASRVTARTRIVVETRTVQIDVRREELVIEAHKVPADRRDSGVTPGQQDPVVITLWEEAPTVTVTTRPYEKVTLAVTAVVGEQTVTTALSHEQLLP